MKRLSSLAIAAVSLSALSTIAASAAAQTAPGAAPTATVSGSWGTGIPGAPAPTTPGYGPGAAPPGSAPLPPPQGAYPQGGYPQGGYPQGGYPQGGYPQGGTWSSPNGDPTMMGPDGRPRTLPLEMPYDPEKGVPPGYRIGEKPRYNLAVAGISTLGGLWILSSIIGGIIEDNNNNSYSNDRGWPMYIPVVGPFITIGTAHTGASATTSLFFDGLAQVAGATMFFVGMNTSTKVVKFQFGNEVAVTPIVTPTTGGGFAGLSGSF